MIDFSFLQDKKTYPDGKLVKWKELVMDCGWDISLSIRIYPSNTYVLYKHGYRSKATLLHKAPHQEAQKLMADWLSKFFSSHKLGVTGNDFSSIMAMYDKLVHMKMED